MNYSKKELSRRQLIQNAIDGLKIIGLNSMLSNLVVQSIVNQATAQSSSKILKKYIYFSLDGGPPQWMFSLPLTPHGIYDAVNNINGDIFVPSPGLGTYIEHTQERSFDIAPKTKFAKAVYKTWKDPVSGFELPPVWGTHPKGGAFSNVLQHTFFIRGIDGEINNHGVNRFRNVAPVVGGISITGQIADNCVAPIPSVRIGSIGGSFKSLKSISAVEVNTEATASTNPVQRIMEYFNSQIYSGSKIEEQLQLEFDQYQAQIGQQPTGLKQSQKDANTLIKNGVTQFNSLWGSTFNKYNSLINEALLERDNITTLVDNKSMVKNPFFGVVANTLDSDIIKNEKNTLKNSMLFKPNEAVMIENLFNSFVKDSTNVTNLAAVFATIEILFVQNLTQSMSVSIGSLFKLIKNPAGNTFNLAPDQHDVGVVTATFYTNFYYRTILNCLDELITVLKSNQLFNDTVIHIGSEFNRNAKVDGSGSDHGFKGVSSLIISGMIDQTAVIGNIKSEPSGTYKGTWGLSVPHPLTSNKVIRFQDVAMTICSMLGVGNVSNNGKSLLNTDGSRFYSYEGVQGQCKNIS